MSNLPELWRANWSRDFDRFFDQLGGAALRRTDADLTKYGFNQRTLFPNTYSLMMRKV